MLVLKGHTTGQTVYAVAFAPDGASLVSCSLDGTVRLWRPQAGTNEIVDNTYGYMARSVVFSPDGRSLAWCDRPHTSYPNDYRPRVFLRDLGSRDCLSLPMEDSLEDRDYAILHKVRYSPDGRLLAAAGLNVYLWDATTRERRTSWGDGTANGCLAFSSDGQTLAVGHTHRSAQTNRLRHEAVLYDPTTRRPRALLPARRQVKDLTFAPNGRTLAAACENYLTVWELPAEKPVFECQGGKRHFQGIAFTPDGRLLAATHNDRSVRLWDTRDWSERAAFDWGIGEVTCIAFAPDGMRAAAGGRTGRIVIWDVDL
jgi:WD40 repeat protein